MQTPRVTVFVRLLLILVGVAALPTAVVMLLQERALTRDLRDAAASRLERASHAGARLLDDHLADLTARYRAISGTPQFRATLEVGDAATLRFYAGELSRRQDALAVAFVSAAGEITAGGAEPGLAREAWTQALDAVVERDGRLLTVTRIPLRTGDEQVGSLVAVDDLSPDILAAWSETCGAELAFQTSVRDAPDRLVRSVRRIGSGHLTISSSLEAEAQALAHARRNLATAGGLALALAIAASILLSRSWVRPIHRMRHAAERIGRGDLDARVRIRRSDEIGDVARAFDEMALRLTRQQEALETQVRQLEEGRERLRNAQRLARMGSWRLRLDGKQVEVSEELSHMLGLPGAPPTRDLGELLALVHPEERRSLVEAVRACLEQGGALHADHRVVLPDGGERILQTQARVRRDPEDGGVLLEGTAQDVTERRRSEEQIRFLAYHDGLTGLGNRRLFQERLDLAIAEARRSEQPFGILFVDLDQFKRINDTLGHSVGDLLLQGVADRLVSSVRESDLVARGEFATAVSRFGGDEFVVLATGLNHVRELARIARRLLTELARPFSLQGHEIVTTVSIGIAAWPEDGDDAEALLRNADAAMHHAKERGRNNHQFYAAAMNEEALQRLILESRLRRALEGDEFELHYQPKLDAAGRRVTGVEALARWQDPQLGMVLPGEFIPVAEETGLIGSLGEWALREACAQRRRWSDAGLPPFPVAVNLSAHQFRDGSLVERVEAILDDTGTPPELLELEITESTLLRDEAAVVAALEALRKRGVRVAVDDFGTGYSSLAYLGRLPVDALKIDRGFVVGIEGSRGEAALAAAIVAMGHALDLRVVAEGVETESQSELLREWGCDELQGFLFARPMPASGLEAWWRERGLRTTRG